MCCLLAYLDSPISLEHLLYKPEHSLIVQSYQPREMISGVINADGFGVGWYHNQKDTDPFFYKNTLPIWNDINLPSLSRYVESKCVLAYVRSATPGQAIALKLELYCSSMILLTMAMCFTDWGKGLLSK